MNFPPSNIAEHHVQFAFRHLLGRGDVAYDVGANRGWLTVPMARLIGRKGILVCFEPSPRNLDHLNRAVLQHGLANVEVVSAAVYERSGEVVQLFENRFSNTDSLYFRQDGSSAIDVPTIALDDFWKLTELAPTLIKMDIEGAEYDALVGASELFQKHRPTCILEFRKTDTRALEWLIARGYCAFNLKDYEPIQHTASIAQLGILEDLIFVHASRMNEGRLTFLRERPMPFQSIDGHLKTDGGTALIRNLGLERGINCFRLACSSRDEGISLEFQVVRRANCVVNFRGAYRQVAVPHLSFVVYSERPDSVDAVITCVSGHEAVQVRCIERRLVPLAEADHRHHAILDLVTPFGLAGQQFTDLLQEAIDGEHTANSDLLLENARSTSSLSNDPRVIYLSGVRSHQLGRYREATDAFRRCLKTGFAPYWGNLRLALSLEALGQFPEAIEVARASLAATDTVQIRSVIERLMTHLHEQKKTP